MRISTLGRQAEFAIDVQTRRRLSIGVIGGLTLSVAGAPLPLGNRKARAMLAYLALENAPLPRERVATMFWSELPERHARNSLRQTLFELREALSLHNCNVLEVRRDDMCLMRGAVDLDFHDLLDAIAAGRPPEMLWRSTQGAELLLAGYEDLSPDFRDWVATTRRHSQNRLLRALETAYQNAAISPDVRRQVAETALQFDPLNESACRSVMQLAATAGEVGVALRAYAALYRCSRTATGHGAIGGHPGAGCGDQAWTHDGADRGSAAGTPEHLRFGAGGAAWWCAYRSGTCLCFPSAPTK